MDTLAKVPSKPRYNRVALAGPAEPPEFVPVRNDAGAAYHGFDLVMTQEEYEAAQAKEECAQCGKTFTYTPETLGKSGKYYCKQECHEIGTAVLVKRKPEGETYNGIDI